jgi:hypothetical protein
MLGTMFVKLCGSSVEDTTVVAALGEDSSDLDVVIACDDGEFWTEAVTPPPFCGVSRDWYPAGGVTEQLVLTIAIDSSFLFFLLPVIIQVVLLSIYLANNMG